MIIVLFTHFFRKIFKMSNLYSLNFVGLEFLDLDVGLKIKHAC